MLTKTNFDVTVNKRYDGDNNGGKNENFDGRGNFQREILEDDLTEGLDGVTGEVCSYSGWEK